MGMKDQPELRDQPASRGDRPVDAGSQALSEALRSSMGIVRIVMGILILLFIFSGFFTVGPQERAIILRMGRQVGEGDRALLGPGPHWSFPYPIDEVHKISISGIQQVRSTVGWYATTPALEAAGTEPPPGPTMNPLVDGYVLTADGNIIHSRVTVVYRINDPKRYVFGFVNASNAIQSAADNAILETAASYKVDDILTRDVLRFREAVTKHVREVVAAQDLGVVIDQCDVQSIPPRQLKDAFANVLKAEVTRSKVLNEAKGYENQVLSKASADADSRINLAQSERSRLVSDISSRANQFEQLLPKYLENPGLFVQQRLTETLGRVLNNVQEKIMVPSDTAGKTLEFRYNINREPPKPKTEEEKKP
jgi:membrane protease subunit HflK